MEKEIKEWQRLRESVNVDEFPRIAAELDEKIARLNLELQQALAAEVKVAPPSSVPPAAPAVEYVSLQNFAWDQTTELVKIYVTLPNAESAGAENVKVEFGDESLDLKVMGLGGKNYRLNMKKLGHGIDPSGSKFRVKKDSISITLKKAKWQWWDSIQFKESVLSKRGGAKEKDPAAAKADAGASVMNLMKDLYDSGDDEMKRTIKKAWAEAEAQRSASGGIAACTPNNF